MENNIEIFKTTDNEIEISVKLDNDTVWLSQSQMVILFQSSKANVSEHLKNIFQTGELISDGTVRKFRTVQTEGKRTVSREIEHYNLDVIISLGYRVNTFRGIQFRQWATQRLKDFLIDGFAIDKKRIKENKIQFLQTLDDIKFLTKNNTQIKPKDILSLIQSFSDTFFALDSYDKNIFPNQGTQKEILTSALELQEDLQKLKNELIKKGEATELFGQEKRQGSLEGIFGSVFQSVFGQDAYQNIEEKAAHLMYFIIKNHPFNDGNKRSGAFSFIWLLQKAGIDFYKKINPETLTTITILMAESKPEDKQKMIGIILLLLHPEKDKKI